MPRAGRSTPARRQPAKQRVRATRLLAELHRVYPEADCALTHRNPFQLLVSTILSAQCTDVRVNMVTQELFALYPDAPSLAKVRLPTLERIIHSTGFFRNKAKNIKGAAQRIVQAFDGQVPQTMDELLSLPGVARKTANVVLGTAFGRNDGVVVDTHVGRLSRRLALTAEQNPVKVERDLMAVVPRDDWTWISHALILHGRAVCDARKPRCEECTLAPDCPSAGAV